MNEQLSMEKLQNDLRIERDLANKLAVELAALNNTFIFNERQRVLDVLELWKKMRAKKPE
jgi:hypothetical protein